MAKAFTDRFIAGLKFSGHTRTVNDSKTRGLALRVGAQGKVWYFRYRNGGPQQWLKLGEYPAIGLADARGRVNKERATMTDGLDPVEERRKAEAQAETPPPSVSTFKDFVPVF